MTFLYVFLTIFLALIPGMIIFRIVFAKKFTGIIFYCLAWLIGWAYIAFGLYWIQFVHYGIGLGTYLFLNLVLLIILWIKIAANHLSFDDILNTLRIDLDLFNLKKSYNNLSNSFRWIFWIILLYIIIFAVVSFVHNISFPSYHMDTNLHWNMPAVEIMYKGGIDLYQDYSSRAYPLFVSIYKALVALFSGGVWQETLANIWQWIIFAVFGLFITTVTWQKTKNILYSILPIALISALPLVYFQVVDGYLDLAMVIYIVIASRALYQYLQEKKSDFILLGVLLLSVASFLKNDGAFVYIPIILIAFLITLLSQKIARSTIKDFFAKQKNTVITVISGLFFVLPHILFTLTKDTGINSFGQASIDTNNFHGEIFPMFSQMFFAMGTYNVVLIILFILIVYFIYKKLYRTPILVLFISPVLLFLHMLFTVFALSSNFLWFLNQTSSNRLFTMVFVLLLSFIGFYLVENESK